MNSSNAELVQSLIDSSIKKYKKHLTEREELLASKQEENTLLEIEVHRIRGAIAGYNELSQALSNDSKPPEIGDNVPETLRDQPLFDGQGGEDITEVEEV